MGEAWPSRALAAAARSDVLPMRRPLLRLRRQLLLAADHAGLRIARVRPLLPAWALLSSSSLIRASERRTLRIDFSLRATTLGESSTRAVLVRFAVPHRLRLEPGDSILAQGMLRASVMALAKAQESTDIVDSQIIVSSPYPLPPMISGRHPDLLRSRENGARPPMRDC